MRRTLCLGLSLLFFVAATTEAQELHSAKDYYKRGVTRYGKGDLDGAIADLNSALKLDPLYAEAHFNRGKARRAKGDLDGAIEDFEKAIEIDPRTANNNRDISQAYINRGFMRSNQLDIDAAINDFNKALKVNAKDSDAYFKRGRALLIKGDLVGASRFQTGGEGQSMSPRGAIELRVCYSPECKLVMMKDMLMQSSAEWLPRVVSSL